MAVLNKRTRIVSFRVSKDEYEILLDLTRKQGAHSVSEFARSTAFLASNRNSTIVEVKTQAQVQDLQGRVQELFNEIQELSRRIDFGLAEVERNSLNSSISPENPTRFFRDP